MKKVSFVLALVIALSCVLASCSSYKAFKVDPNYVSQRSEDPNQTISGLDNLKVSVPKQVSKVVCFSPEATVIFSEVGSTDRIKGVDEASAEFLGSGATKLTVDKIASVAPDVVFISEEYQTAALDNAGIPYFTVPKELTISDIKSLIKIIEKICGITESSLTTEIDNQFNLAYQSTADYANKYPTFIDLGDYNTSGSGTYVNEMISVSGGENIFAEEEGFITVKKADIIKANPTFIFTVGNKNTYTDDPDFAEVEAVKKGNVFKISKNSVCYGTNKIADGISTVFEKINGAKAAK